VEPEPAELPDEEPRLAELLLRGMLLAEEPTALADSEGDDACADTAADPDPSFSEMEGTGRRPFEPLDSSGALTLAAASKSVLAGRLETTKQQQNSGMAVLRKNEMHVGPDSLTSSKANAHTR